MDSSSSLSNLEDTLASLTVSSGAIDDDESNCEINAAHVVSAPEIRCSKENDLETCPAVEESEAKELVKSKTIAEVEEEKTIKHYSSQHKILLVGEGDFSFSACLALAFGSAANIIATSHNSEAFLKEHYGKAMSNIEEIRRREGKVMHEIDATEMANHELLGQLKFDRIVFNFLHAGFFDNLSRESQLCLHRELVSKFLMNAKKMISENGEIHITHKTNGGLHERFDVESIASSHGLRLVEAVRFELGDYPGYNTKYGFGGDANFDCNPSKTFKFGLI